MKTTHIDIKKEYIFVVRNLIIIVKRISETSATYTCVNVNTE